MPLPNDPERSNESGALVEQVRRLEQENHDLRLLLDGLRRSRIYRALTALGRWRDFDRRVVARLLPSDDGDGRARVRWSVGETEPPAVASKILAIDLTALLPGALNGGAKIGALEVSAAMIHQFPERRFIVFKRPGFEEAFRFESAPNVQVVEIDQEPDALAKFVNDTPIGSLYCPMTSPPWRDARVPLVCRIHDIQHETYPEFFSGHELEMRRQHITRSIQWSDRLVVSTAYVKTSLEDTLGVEPGKVSVVPWRLAARFTETIEQDQVHQRALEKLGLSLHPYFFYPANFWLHKNHHLLLSAFARIVHDREDLDYRLVFTGAEHPAPGPTLAWAQRLGIGDRVHFLGFVSEVEMAALYDGARALLFPSLYEGFGLPVLEAMARGCPVLCSNSTALPEVSGDAALLVDPRNVDDIYRGMVRLADDQALVDDLRQRGKARATGYSSVEEQAKQVVGILDQVMASHVSNRPMIVGRWPDGWTGDRLFLFHGVEKQARIVLANPSPDAVSVVGPQRQRLSLGPLEQVEIECSLPGKPGVVGFSITSRRMSEDDPRSLGVLVPEAYLGGANGTNLIATV